MTTELVEGPASAVLASAAVVVADWPAAYGTPLADLLAWESQHAERLETEAGPDGWLRYPPGATLLQLARGVLTEQAPA